MDYIDERKKKIDEYEKSILPTLYDQAQQVKKTSQKLVNIGKELSEKMEDLTDITKTKLEYITENREIILKSNKKNWTSFVTSANRDRFYQQTLDQLNSELSHEAYSLSMMAASGSTSVDSSGNAGTTLFTIVANEKHLPVESISPQYYQRSTLENKNTIRFGLNKLLPNYLHEFNDVIRDWESKTFRDMKRLSDLRNVIFGKVFGLMNGEKRYKLTIWFKNNFFLASMSSEKEKDYYYKVLYFILGENDPNIYPPSLVSQMVEIANNLAILHGELSRFGRIRKQETPDSSIEIIFKDTLYYTAAAFRIREGIQRF